MHAFHVTIVNAVSAKYLATGFLDGNKTNILLYHVTETMHPFSFPEQRQDAELMSKLDCALKDKIMHVWQQDLELSQHPQSELPLFPDEGQDVAVVGTQVWRLGFGIWETCGCDEAVRGAEAMHPIHSTESGVTCRR